MLHNKYFFLFPKNLFLVQFHYPLPLFRIVPGVVRDEVVWCKLFMLEG